MLYYYLNRYISLQAPLRLGFDDSIRAKIECSICQPDIDAGPSVDTFDQAAWIVYIILQRVNLKLIKNLIFEIFFFFLGIFSEIFRKYDILSIYQ